MSTDMEGKVLGDWEEIFKQGLLTFWVLTALQDAALTVNDLGKEVAQLTRNTYTPAEQTLYRLLRKQHALKLVEFSETPSSRGPNYKQYSLTSFGERMLKEFTQRNIELFLNERIQKNLRGEKA